jgi:hypothetical protein
MEPHVTNFYPYVRIMKGLWLPKVWFNSGLAKAGVSCFYESEVINPSFVHLIKFSAENPRLRKAAKRYGAF